MFTARLSDLFAIVACRPCQAPSAQEARVIAAQPGLGRSRRQLTAFIAATFIINKGAIYRGIKALTSSGAGSINSHLPVATPGVAVIAQTRTRTWSPAPGRGQRVGSRPPGCATGSPAAAAGRRRLPAPVARGHDHDGRLDFRVAGSAAKCRPAAVLGTASPTDRLCRPCQAATKTLTP